MMPKLSISVPDDLWAQACAEVPGLGPSQLVQALLRRYVARSQGRLPFVRQRSPENSALLEQTLHRVAARTQATYDDGYQAGLAFAEEAPWKLIEELAQQEWDFDQWLEAWHTNHSNEAASEEEQFLQDRVTAAATGRYHHDATFRSGFSGALLDLWVGLTAEEPPPRTSIADPSVNSNDVPFE